MISESTRFLAQPREMRLTLIMQRKGGHAASVCVKSKNGPDRTGPQGAERFERDLLLLRRHLGLLFLALEVSGAAFAFDLLVQLLAHGGWKSEGSIFQREEGESRLPPVCLHLKSVDSIAHDLGWSGGAASHTHNGVSSPQSGSTMSNDVDP